MFNDKMFYVFASLSFIYIIFMTGKKNNIHILDRSKSI